MDQLISSILKYKPHGEKEVQNTGTQNEVFFYNFRTFLVRITRNKGNLSKGNIRIKYGCMGW